MIIKPKKYIFISAFAIVNALALNTADADVSRRCASSTVCGQSTWDGHRVNIYLDNSMSGATHYNFKGNPGDQIEISGNYSFNARSGQSGTYSAQVCRRGGIGVSSFCTQWATFRWNATHERR